MNFFEFPIAIKRYAENHTSEEDKILHELYRTTHLKTIHPQMLSGKVQGQFLSMLSQMLQPRAILEIGTFTGYSAYCLSKGLSKEGAITTIEVNEEMEEMVLNFFEEAGISEKTNLLIGDALELIPTLDKNFDLVFIDANKEHYVTYYELCIEKIRPGGFMIVDNVLWGGKVAESPTQDESTRKVHEFNEIVTSDPRVENVFLTIRDGLMLIRKRYFV